MKKQKKIILSLSLIATVAAPLATVISCSKTSNSGKDVSTDQKKADAIASEIVTTKYLLPEGTNLDITNKATIRQINSLLIANNPTLNVHDAQTITYSTKKGLKANNYVDVTATIKINDAHKDVKLSIEVTPTPQQLVDDLASKFTVTAFTLPDGTPADINNTATIDALDKLVMEKNPQITEAELNTNISYSGSLVYGDSSNDITVKFESGDAVKTIETQVHIASTDQQKVADIIKVITDKDVSVPINTNTSTNNAETKKAITASLFKANPGLAKYSDYKGRFFKYLSSAKLISDTPVAVPLTVEVGNAKQTISLNVTLTPTNTELLATIKALITDVNISLPKAKVINNTPASEYKAELNKELFIANKGLDKYVNYISYSGTMSAGTTSNITINLVVNRVGDGPEATSPVALAVQTNLDPAQQVAKIKAKITNTAITVPAPSGTTPDNYKKYADISLQNANDKLTADDLKTISYTGDLTVGTPAQVTLTIQIGEGNQAATTNVAITITLQRPQDYVNGIKDAINGIKITLPKGSLVLTDHDKDIINAQIKLQRSKLTDEQLNTLSYTGTIAPGSEEGTTINFTSTYGGKVATGTITIFMDKTDLQLANTIAAKISLKSYPVTTPTLDVSKAANTKSMDVDLKQANGGLTADDMTHITYTGILINETPTPVIATISVGQVKVPVTLTLTYKSPTAVSAVIAKGINKAINTGGSGNPIEIEKGLPKEDASKSNDSINKKIFDLGQITSAYKEYVTYSGEINPTKPGYITAHINVLGTKTDITNLYVVSPISGAQIVQAIAAKISDGDLVLPGLLYGTKNDPNTIDASYSYNNQYISEGLKRVNPSLTSADLARITYSGMLKFNSDDATMNVIIKADGASKTLQLKPMVNPALSVQTIGVDQTTDRLLITKFELTRGAFNLYKNYYKADGGLLNMNELSKIMGHYWQFIDGGQMSGNTWTGYASSPATRKWLAEGGIFKYGWANDHYVKKAGFGWGSLTSVATAMSDPGSKNTTEVSTWLLQAIQYTNEHPLYTKVEFNLNAAIDGEERTDSYGYTLDKAGYNGTHIAIYQYGKLVKAWGMPS